MDLTTLAQDKGYDGARGCHSGATSAALAQDAAHAQDGLCWLCREPFTDTDPARADRLVNGTDLGVCNYRGDCAGSHGCRCGYRAGNVGAAHDVCNVGVRQALSAAQVYALAVANVPTAAAVAQAREERRGTVGRETRRAAQVARRTALAQAAAQA